MAPSRPDFTVSLPIFENIRIKLAGGGVLEINRNDYDLDNTVSKIEYSKVMAGGKLAELVKKK